MGFSSVLEVRGLRFVSLLPAYYDVPHDILCLSFLLCKMHVLCAQMLSGFLLEQKYLDKLLMFSKVYLEAAQSLHTWQ